MASPSLFFRALLLALLCAAPAQAAAVVVQVATCSSATTCAFTNAPANGDVVAFFVFSAGVLTSTTVADSNGIALTQHQPASNCVALNALCGGVYDYSVSGSPTKTYTLSGITLPLSAYNLVEASGITLTGAVYAANNATTVTTTLVATIAGVKATDLGIGSLNLTADVGSPTVALSNGTNVTAGGFGVTAIATTTASSTFTATASTSMANPVVLYADYRIEEVGPGGAGGSAPWIGGFVPAPDWRALCAEAA